MSRAIDEGHILRPARPAGRCADRKGKDWCRLSVGVGEGEETAWVSVSVFEEKARALVGLNKGVEVYCEGRLSLNSWTGKDGAQRIGLAVAAWRVEVLGQIGKRKPKARPRDEQGVDRAHLHAVVPFDDRLTF